MMEDPIELLERRIAALELKVMPAQVSEESLAKATITDLLLQTNTLIASALSGREIITTILNRMIELNQFLDPNYYENKLTVAAKRQFILALYPEMKKYGESIQRLKALVPVLDSAELAAVPSLGGRLQQLTLAHLGAHEEGHQVSESIARALHHYNDIIYSISRTFVQLEEVVTHLETDMKRTLVTE